MVVRFIPIMARTRTTLSPQRSCDNCADHYLKRRGSAIIMQKYRGYKVFNSTDYSLGRELRSVFLSLCKPTAYRTLSIKSKSISKFQIHLVLIVRSGHCRLNAHLFKTAIAQSPHCSACTRDRRTFYRELSLAWISQNIPTPCLHSYEHLFLPRWPTDRPKHFEIYGIEFVLSCDRSHWIAVTY